MSSPCLARKNLAVNEQADKADADNEEDAEDEDDSGISIGPVTSWARGRGCLLSGEYVVDIANDERIVDGRHCDRGRSCQVDRLARRVVEFSFQNPASFVSRKEGHLRSEA